MKAFKYKPANLLLILILWIIPARAPAQSFYLNPIYASQFTLQALKPNFNGPDNTTFTTGAYFLNYQIRLNAAIDLIGDFSLAHFADKGSFGFSSAQTSAGNPFLGLRVHGRGSHFSGEVGLRIPVVSDSKFVAATVGLVSDFDRFEAFLAHWLPISANLNYTANLSRDVSLLMKAGGTFQVNRDKDPFEDSSELYLQYALGVRQRSRRVQAMVAFSGRLHVTESNLDFGQRTFHQLGFSADLLFRQISPGVEVRIPLDRDLTTILDFVAGVRVTVPLNSGRKRSR